MEDRDNFISKQEDTNDATIDSDQRAYSKNLNGYVHIKSFDEDKQTYECTVVGKEEEES